MPRPWINPLSMRRGPAGLYVGDPAAHPDPMRVVRVVITPPAEQAQEARNVVRHAAAHATRWRTRAAAADAR